MGHSCAMEIFFHQFHNLVEGRGSLMEKNHSVGRIVLVDETYALLMVKGAHGFLVAENIMSQGLPGNV